MRLRCVGLLTALLTLGCAKRPAPIQPVPDSGHLLGELRVDTPGYLTFELVRPAFTTVVLFRGDQPPMLLQSEPTASPVGIAGPSVLSVRLSPALFGRRVSWVSRPACVRRVLTSRIEDGRPVREYQRLCDGLYRTGSLVRSSPGTPCPGQGRTLARGSRPAALRRRGLYHRPPDSTRSLEPLPAPRVPKGATSPGRRDGSRRACALRGSDYLVA